MEAESTITQNVENEVREIAKPTLRKPMDEIIEFINQQQRTEELERVTANFHEKIRRRRDGTPPDYQAFYEAKTGVYYIPDG